MSDFGVNIFSQGQIQRVESKLKIVAVDIKTGQDLVMAKLINKDFYIFNTLNF